MTAYRRGNHTISQTENGWQIEAAKDDIIATARTEAAINEAYEQIANLGISKYTASRDAMYAGLDRQAWVVSAADVWFSTVGGQVVRVWHSGGWLLTAAFGSDYLPGTFPTFAEAVAALQSHAKTLGVGTEIVLTERLRRDMDETHRVTKYVG